MQITSSVAVSARAAANLSVSAACRSFEGSEGETGGGGWPDWGGWGHNDTDNNNACVAGGLHLIPFVDREEEGVM